MFVRSHDYRVGINFEISNVFTPAIYSNKRLDIPFWFKKRERNQAIRYR